MIAEESEALLYGFNVTHARRWLLELLGQCVLRRRVQHAVP